MQADIVYRPVMMTERVRELEGKRIKLKGVMHPDAKLKKIAKAPPPQDKPKAAAK